MKKILFFLMVALIAQLSFGQKVYRGKNVISGHVVSTRSDSEHIPYASIMVKGTTIGITTNESGHYTLRGVPNGHIVLIARAVGYSPQEKTVDISNNQSLEVDFELREDVLNLDEIVITGSREVKTRKESPVIVNSLSPQLFKTTQAVTLSEGLNFSPGLRMETNCQNCGFNQIRMNGMEGPYSQILINGRPIFSGLAGVYGMELIPTNMIEKVEVVRGGGSALYGSNAIAGTINMILKDPLKNSYSLGMTTGIVGVGVDGSGDPAHDNAINFNASTVSDDYRKGLSVYGFHRKASDFDANNDGFSEIVRLSNSTIGSRLFHQVGDRGKITFNFFHISENRRGGNRFEYPEHEADIAEALQHKVTTGTLVYDQFFSNNNKLSIYTSGQMVDRDSYYGTYKSLSDYGKTNDYTINSGIQFNGKIGENQSYVVGAENTTANLKDKKPGYLDIENIVIVNDSTIEIPHTELVNISDQSTMTNGIFGQYSIKAFGFEFVLGGRFDNYQVKNNLDDKAKNSGSVFSPRANILYNITPDLQFRLNYSQGYRAPQIFDEDLHIEVAGAKRIIHRNDPNLKKETSQSFMGSLDFNKQLSENAYIDVLIEGFYTQLNDAFANERGEPDENNVVTYIRKNADGGASIYGVNTELKIIPTRNLNFTAGFTVQRSEYEKPQDLDQKKFLRTPDNYGFFTTSWNINKQFTFSLTGNYTGKMLLPYEGTVYVNEQEEADAERWDGVIVRESKSFVDLGSKLSYTFDVGKANFSCYAGIKNIFNSYQNDFDIGIDRDAGYIYGPRNPRTIYFGLTIGSL